MRTFFSSMGLSRSTFSSNFIPILAVLVLSILSVTPIFGNSAYLVPLWGFLFFLQLSRLNRANRNLGSILILGIIFVLICIIYKLAGISSAKMGYCMTSPFLFFAPVLALMIIDRCNNVEQIKFLFHFLALAVAINIADNIRLSYLFGMENVVFQKLSGVIEEEDVVGLNFGGSLFVNMAVFYACMMFMAFLKSSKRLEKLLFLIYVSISAYFIIMCSLKASAIVFMLISMVLMYVSVKSKEHTGLIILLLIFIGGSVSLFIDNIIHFLVSVIGSERIADRLIIFTSEGDLEGTSLMSRAMLWQTSFQSWVSSVSSFFFGLGDHNWNDVRSTSDYIIGCHSDVLDVLARYGVFGAFILYSSIKKYYDYLKKKYGNSFKYEIISFFVLILLMGSTKRIVSAQPAIMLFILFPLTLSYCSKKDYIR